MDELRDRLAEDGEIQVERVDLAAELIQAARHGGFKLVGGIAGWLAGVVMKGGGYGVIGDIVVGIVGALIGGWLFGALGISAGGGLLGSIIVAFVGAVILILILRAIKRA